MQSRRAHSSPLTARGIADGTRIVLKRGFQNGQLQYTAPITVAGQEFDVQVDTGSSDLWIASTDCNTNSCRPKTQEVRRLDPSSATSKDVDFNITYLAGSAAGPILQAPVSFGGYQIPQQSFAAASDVQSEQLGSIGASGVLGLALPVNSIIQENLYGDPPSNANNSVKSPTLTGSILPGIWNGTQAGKSFFSIGLQRLPSDGGNGNSTLTFGGYDSDYLPNPSAMQWVAAVPDPDRNVRKWQTFVSQFFVSINNTDTPIPIRTIDGGTGFATVILDTAASYNYGVPRVLNGLYGAYNIGPARDGSQAYYPDCNLMMQVSLVINGQVMTIHPLDMNLRQTDPATASSAGCIGGFQPLLGANPPADLVLGAPFLRSVYTAYSCDSILVNPAPGQMDNCQNPQIGFAPLLNNSMQRAAGREQFNSVRVQGKSLGSDASISNDSTGQSSSSGGLSGGVKIAIGVVGGLVAILAIMFVLLLLLKRRRARAAAAAQSARSIRGNGVEKDDAGEDGDPDAPQLSAKERAQARDLALLHGFLPEEALPGESDDEARATLQPTGQTWDVTSTGYYEALAIKNEWKRKNAEQAGYRDEPPPTATSSRYSDRKQAHSEEYELSEHGSAAPLHPRAI